MQNTTHEWSDAWRPFEITLSRADRLGLAYCRFYHNEWDEYIAPKPAGYDYLGTEEKSAMTSTVVRNLEEYIGPAEASRCWWKFVRGASETEWLSWYMLEDHRPQKSRR